MARNALFTIRACGLMVPSDRESRFIGTYSKPKTQLEGEGPFMTIFYGCQYFGLFKPKNRFYVPVEQGLKYQNFSFPLEEKLTKNSQVLRHKQLM